MRHAVHIGFSLTLLAVIVFLKYAFTDSTTIDLILKMASLTYGPLIGLFAAGLFTQINYRDKWIPFICLISPVICFILSKNSKDWLGGYELGNELILLNGLLTFIFLLLLKTKKARV